MNQSCLGQQRIQFTHGIDAGAMSVESETYGNMQGSTRVGEKNSIQRLNEMGTVSGSGIYQMCNTEGNVGASVPSLLSIPTSGPFPQLGLKLPSKMSGRNQPSYIPIEDSYRSQFDSQESSTNHKVQMIAFNPIAFENTKAATWDKTHT